MSIPRKMPRLASIRARMTALVAAAAALLMASSIALMTWNTHREVDLSARSSLASMAQSLREPMARNASLDELGRLVAAHNQTVMQNALLGAEVEAWLMSPQGKVKWLVGPWSGRSPSPYGNSNQNSASSAELLLGPDRHHFLELQRGADTLTISIPWRRTAGVLRGQMVSLMLLGALATAFAALGTWFLVGKTLSPITKLASQAQDLAQSQSFNGRLQMTSSDAELQELTSTLNGMLDSLAEAARSKERFHAAASHELRTPLQALLGHLQLALSRVRSPEEYHKALAESERQTQRLSSLTNELLFLNQLQMATTSPPREKVEVTEIVAQNIDSYTERAIEKGLKVTESLVPFEIETVPSHLEMLTHNLIENAVKYAPAGTPVIMEANPHHLKVWNEIEASHLLNLDLDRLFDPFFRPDDARHSSTGGNGLGLSICQALCQANGWNITLERTVREFRPGLQVTVEFRHKAVNPLSFRA